MLTNHAAIVKGGLFWPVAAIELAEEVMPMVAASSQAGARSQGQSDKEVELKGSN